MSGRELPDAPPPEVPEEFAAAYREAFRRALGSDDAFDAEGDEEPVGASLGTDPGQHRVTDHRPTTAFEAVRESRWFLPGLVALLALVLIVGAYGVGRAFSSGVADDREPATAATPEKPRPGAVTTPPAPRAGARAWRGEVRVTPIDSITASCTMPAGRDAAGRSVPYNPGNSIDGRPATAWRCAGDAVGERLELKLPEEVEIGQVGLVAGYAKTDPRSGADRYAENNRVMRVRWTLADGVVVEQKLRTGTSIRGLQSIRVPKTATRRIVLEILSIERGPRNSTAISEIGLAAID